MIQRIQSIYLLIAGLALLGLLPFEVVWSGATAHQFVWFTPAVLVVAGLAALAALAVIFLYGNRNKQLKAVLVLKYLTLGVCIVLYGGFWLGDEFMVADSEGILWGRLIPIILPVIAYVSFFLAQRAIRADIELVRSMDRLR